MEGFIDNKIEILKGLLINVRNNQNEVPPSLIYMEKKKVKVAIIKINKIINIIPAKNIMESNIFLPAGANSVSTIIGFKKGKALKRKNITGGGKLSRGIRNCVKI